MRLDSEGLRELYQRETARSARRLSGDCLTEDMLTRAAAGELKQLERESVADHLATCSDCAKEYQAIKSLRVLSDEAPEGVSPITLPASGNGHRYRMAGDAALPEAPFGSRKLSFYFPYAIAAASLILSLALGALLISNSRENKRLMAEAQTNITNESKTAEELAQSRRLLEQESAARRAAEQELAKRNATESPTPRRSASPERSAPDVNVPIIDLNPQDAGRGGQNQKATTIQLPADTDLFTLILNLSGDDSSNGYSLEVRDRNNRAIWTSRDLRKSPYNNFTVALRRHSLPAGEYRLKIYGLREGRREVIEEYAIRLLY